MIWYSKVIWQNYYWVWLRGQLILISPWEVGYVEGYQLLSMVPRIYSLRLMRKQQQQEDRDKFSYITESRKRLHGTWFTLWPTYDTRWALTTTFTLKSPIQRLLATATQLSPVAESAVSRTLESGVDSWTGLRTHLTTGLDRGRGCWIDAELMLNWYWTKSVHITWTLADQRVDRSHACL